MDIGNKSIIRVIRVIRGLNCVFKDNRAIERIAEVNDAIDLSICDVLKHRHQGNVITVNVGYDRDPHEFLKHLNYLSPPPSQSRSAKGTILLMVRPI
jgi:hypothetical protein